MNETIIFVFCRPMIHDELKKLRKENDLTLKVLSSRVGYGTGNLSSYENGKIQARDKTLFRILTRGFGLSANEAKGLIVIWRKKELEEKYNIQLAQPDESYNSSVTRQTLDKYLASEGLDKDGIKKIKRDIQVYKRKLK